jgi:hypothetical protein
MNMAWKRRLLGCRIDFFADHTGLSARIGVFGRRSASLHFTALRLMDWMDGTFDPGIHSRNNLSDFQVREIRMNGKTGLART